MIYRPRRPAGATGRVYDHLFDQIVHDGLRPGVLLSESELAKQLESSRTPVREALLMLEGNGLVKRYPGRGYLVTEITSQDVDEIFEIRLALERCALRKAFGLIGEREVEALEGQLLALDDDSSPDDYYSADRALHQLLALYCGNSRLQEFLGTLDSQIERVRCISARRPDRLKESRREHLDILQAIQAGDLPLAEERLGLHITNVGLSTKQVCQRRKVRQPFPREQPQPEPGAAAYYV